MTMEASPVFMEAYFDEDLIDANLMLEINGEWFYKAPGVNCIDMASAFFTKKVEAGTELTLKIFAPPATGENDESQGEDWQMNYYYTMPELPRIRVRYSPIA